jgi:hypothetical protein
MKTIPLTNSKKVAFVDDRDFKRVSKFKWWMDKAGYIHRASRPRISLPKFIRGTAPKGYEWDHRDLNKRNNRRKNIRSSTRRQNCQHKRKRSDNTSGYKGVSWSTWSKAWWARICLNNGTRISLGHFDDKRRAARAYDEAAFRHHGKFAVLNFPVRRSPR